MARGRWAVAGIVALVAAGPLGVIGARATTPAPAPATSARASLPATIEVSGRGNGHGRGMGQWGAYGYAIGAGWDWTTILDHYYGGTSAGSIDAGPVTVELRELSGAPAIAVEHTGGQLVSGAVAGTFAALQAVPRADGRWDLNAAPSCAGPWEPVPDGQGVDRPDGIDFDLAGGADPGAGSLDGMVGLCEPDGQVRYYRGWLRAAATSSGTRAINVVPMEAYLRGVVPHESPPSWGTAGGGAGMHALRAQAVAARSYAASQARYAWASTCDTTSCQVYRGAWVREPSGAIVGREFATTDAAIAETAGVIRRTPGGAVASTEYSSSTGGWTAGGAYPAVRDEGDEIAAALSSAAAGEHAWTRTVATAAIEARWPAVGTLTGIEVTRRNGLGEWGGRVGELVLRGSAGDVALSGDAFRLAFGLRSDWFAFGPEASCGSGGAAPPVVGVPAAEPTTFHPLVPARILDTRDGTGAPVGRLGAGCTLVLSVAERGGVPVGARAVSLNLTATEAAGDGYLTAYPCGTEPPPTSSLNFGPDVDRANLVTVPVGVDDTVCVYAYATVHVLADVAGWFGADAEGAGFTGVRPERVLDTRDGTGTGVIAPLGADGTVAVDVGGRAGVPASGASAVVLNLTATEATGRGYLAVSPCDAAGYASALNHEAGVDIANQVVVPIDGDGRVCVTSSAGAHVVVDVAGWYGTPGDGVGARYVPLPPARIVDTRSDVPPGAQRADAGAVLGVDVLAVGEVPAEGVGAVTFNLTAADPAERGYLSAFPCEGAPPNASNVNHPATRAAANTVTVPLGPDGRVCVFTYAATDVVVDLAGYYA